MRPAARLVALVDDSRAFLLGWRRAVAPHADVAYFASPAAFLAAAAADPQLYERLVALVTDHRFADGDLHGVAFARQVRARRPELPIVLSSSGFFSRAELDGAIDLVIEKTPVPFCRLTALLAEAAQAPLAERPLRADEPDAA